MINDVENFFKKYNHILDELVKEENKQRTAYFGIQERLKDAVGPERKRLLCWDRSINKELDDIAKDQAVVQKMLERYARKIIKFYKKN